MKKIGSLVAVVLTVFVYRTFLSNPAARYFKSVMRCQHRVVEWTDHFQDALLKEHKAGVEMKYSPLQAFNTLRYEINRGLSKLGQMKPYKEDDRLRLAALQLFAFYQRNCERVFEPFTGNLYSSLEDALQRKNAMFNDYYEREGAAVDHFDSVAYDFAADYGLKVKKEKSD